MGGKCFWTGLPKSQQATFDDLGVDVLEWAVAYFDTVATFYIELPLVLGAGQGCAFECQCGYVDASVRTTAVIHALNLIVAIDEQAAALAFSACDFAILDPGAGHHVVPLVGVSHGL